MSLKIILGQKSQNKSSNIYNLIYEDVQKFKDVLLLVPSQRRVVEENEYMEYLGLDGILNLKITTISEYVKEIIKITNSHVDDRFLNSIDKRVLISKLAKDNSHAFKKYSKVLNKTGFIVELENYVETFRNLDLKNMDTSNFFKSLDVKEDIKEKLTDIFSIYNSYLEFINKKDFIDDNSYIHLYKDIVTNLPKKVYFDGYNNFKEIEYEIIKMYLQKGVDVTISIVTDARSISDIEAFNTSEIFEVSNETYRKLINIAQKEKVNVEEIFIEYGEDKPVDLQNLSCNTFSYEMSESKTKAENINLFLVNNEKSEVYNVAESILSSIKSGYDFKDNIICVTDISKYENIIKKVFLEYNIPYYLDKNEDIINNVFIRYFLIFTKLLIKRDVKSIIKILKIGLDDIDLDEFSIFENYCIEFNISNINNNFVYNSKIGYDLEALNNTRKKILKIFDFSDFDLCSKNVKYYINYIYGRIQKSGVLEKYIDIIQNEIIDENKKSIFIQAISKLNESIDSIYKIYQDEEISYEDFVQLLEMILLNQNVNTIPEVQNEVLILDINKSKSTTKKYVYVLGANEEEFPIISKEDLIFNDDELEIIEENFIKIKESSDSRYNMGLYNIYEIFNLPSCRIDIYIKSANVQGKALNKSRVIDTICEKFDIEIQGKVLNETYEFPTKENLLVSLNDENDKLKKAAIYEYLNNYEVFSDVLKYRKNDDNLKEETLNLVYSDKITSSVSKLESFRKCPFSYCMKYLLNIKKREKFEVSNIDIGTFMHEVIEEFSVYLFENEIMWASLVEDDEFIKCESKIDEIISRKIDKILEKQKESVRYNILKQRLISTIKTIIKMIARSFSQSEFRPYGYEIEFKDGALFAPIMIKSQDKVVELIGKIDRVDIMNTEENMYVRVVDYKSSDRMLDIDSIKEGISIQLLTYLSAFIDNEKKETNLKVLPAAMTYFTISDKLVNLDKISTEDEMKQSVLEEFRLKGIFLSDIELLNKMDNKLDTKERLIDISKQGVSRGSKKAIEEQDFIKLCDEAKKILKDILDEVLDGVVKILPNKKADPCRVCEYEDICRKNIKI